MKKAFLILLSTALLFLAFFVVLNFTFNQEIYSITGQRIYIWNSCSFVFERDLSKGEDGREMIFIYETHDSVYRRLESEVDTTSSKWKDQRGIVSTIIKSYFADWLQTNSVDRYLYKAGFSKTDSFIVLIFDQKTGRLFIYVERYL